MDATFLESSHDDDRQVVSLVIHPTKPWVLVARQSGALYLCSTSTGERFAEFGVDQNKFGPLRSAQFFDSWSLLHTTLIPASLVAEAKTNLVVAVCSKGIVVADLVTRGLKGHAPPALDKGLSGSSKSTGTGALSGAAIGVSCEHIVLGTTHGSLLLASVSSGDVSAFSGTSKVHDKSVTALVAVTGRPSAQLHRARIASGCQGGIVAVWEVICETPIHKMGPRVLTNAAKSPVVDMRFDPSRGRLVCCFGNGSVSVWSFEEQSQEENIIATISDGFLHLGQVDLPRASWCLPEDALLAVTPQGRLGLALPLNVAIRNAKNLLKGTVGVASGDSKLASSATEHAVAVRHMRDIFEPNSNDEKPKPIKIVKFVQHPLHSDLMAIVTSANRICLLKNAWSDFVSMNSVKSCLIHNKVFAVSGDARLVVKTGNRYQHEKTIAFLSPYSPSSSSSGKLIAQFALDDIPKDTIASLSLDRTLDDLWPGPMRTSFVIDDKDGYIILSVCWPHVAKFVILRFKPSSQDIPSIQVLQYGESTNSICFVRSMDSILVIGGRCKEISVSGPTAVVTSNASSKGRSLTSLPSSLLSSSRSFRGMLPTSIPHLSSSNISKTTLNRSNLNLNGGDNDHESEQKKITQYYVCAYKLGDSEPFVEIQWGNSVSDVFTQFDANNDLFLIRSDPALAPMARLGSSSSSKAFSRFFLLSSFINEGKLVPAGSKLPPISRCCAWSSVVKSARVTSYVMTFDDAQNRLVVMDSLDAGSRIRYRSQITLKAAVQSLKFYHGSLFVASEHETYLVLIGANSLQPRDDVKVFSLSARGRNAHPGSLSARGGNDLKAQRRDSLILMEGQDEDENTAFAPSLSQVRAWEEIDNEPFPPWPIPSLHPSLPLVDVNGIARESGDLMVTGSNCKVYMIPVRHPLLRLGMVAAAGCPSQALKWSFSLSPFEQVRDEALMVLESLGWPEEASHVLGASPRLVLDLCCRYRLAERASKIFDTRGTMFAALSENPGQDGDMSEVERLALLLSIGNLPRHVLRVGMRVKDSQKRAFIKSLSLVNPNN